MTLAQAEKELAALREREKLLQAFIDLGKQLDGTGTKDAGAVAPTGNETGNRSSRTADMAYEVLSENGRLHIMELVKRMRAAGWVCSNDDIRDRNAVYAAMHRLPGDFVACGESIWDVNRKRQK